MRFYFFPSFSLYSRIILYLLILRKRMSPRAVCPELRAVYHTDEQGVLEVVSDGVLGMCGDYPTLATAIRS